MDGGKGVRAARDGGDVFALVSRIRDRVSAVTVDGRAEDWSGVPLIPDPAGDAAGRAELDIRGVAVVPTDDVVLVQVATSAAPSRADRTFWIDLDLSGSPGPELQVGISSDGRHFLRTFRADGSPRAVSRMSLPHAVGRVVEVAIPMEALERTVRDRGPLRGKGARSWVRVTAFTWDRESGDLVDFASAASYRIVPGLSLEEPPPSAPGRAVPPAAATVALPVEGRWFVSQGAFAPASHHEVWAWDLGRVDEGMSMSAPPGSCENADFLAWDDPVRAPVSGRVLRSRGDAPDLPACGEADGPPNEVLLEVEPGLALHLAHFRQGSLGVSTGQRVERGTTVARVGNSGLSSGAHLHLGLVRTRPPGGSAPLALRDVRVGLNPVPVDPWARELERWVPREGLFVEAVGEDGGEDPGGS